MLSFAAGGEPKNESLTSYSGAEYKMIHYYLEKIISASEMLRILSYMKTAIEFEETIDKVLEAPQRGQKIVRIESKLNSYLR